MSEITPASSLSHAASSPDKTATGVDLAPVIIKPSQILWRIELVFYCSILCAASIALFPFFLTAFYWLIIWLVFVVLIVFVLRERLRAQKLPSFTLSVQKKVWRLQYSTNEMTATPFDEILLWEGIIILPLREILSGRKYRIVILADSMKAEDWRHLRVWLRTALRNNL